MIHYTAFPVEWAYQDPHQQQNGHIVNIEGVPMMIQLDGSHEATIIQLLSCDPQHYLNPRFQPGNKVQLFPKI